MGCPSDRWFFGSVFVFLVAVGMLAGGAVNMQLASDDPRTPRVKSYDGYVDAWQNTHFAEYNTKYAPVPATATLTRGADADAGSTATVSAWHEARIRRHRRDRPQGYPQRLQEAQQAPRPVRAHRELPQQLQEVGEEERRRHRRHRRLERRSRSSTSTSALPRSSRRMLSPPTPRARR